MAIPWRALGLGTGIAMSLGAAPAAYSIYGALKRRAELLDRAQKLQDEQIPTAALVGTGAALVSGLATYNTMKQRAIRKGWSERNKHAGLDAAFIAKHATVGRAITGGIAAGIPLGLGGYWAAQNAMASGKKRMDEGEQKLQFMENNLMPLSLGAGAILGTLGTALVSRKKFQMPDQNATGYAYPQQYYDPSMMG